MSKIEELVLDKYKEPIENSDELVNAEKYFNGNYTKIENKVNEVIDNTDTRLNTLETDNTNNKQDILSIQQEQINQNNNIAQNKTDIELLAENLADEITTEEAENFTVKDATRWYSKLDVSGNSVQEQTSQSANLWWDNTTRTFNSTETRVQNTTQKIKAGTYTISCDIDNFSLGTNKKMNFSGENEYADGTSDLAFVWLENITGNGRYSKKHTFLQDITKVRLKIGLGELNNGGSLTISNLCLRADDSDEYVEFVLDSPSPTYSSEIKNCGDNINIFDEQMEKGSIDAASGENIATNSIIRSKNYIEIPARCN